MARSNNRGPENRISEIPGFLAQISPDRVTAMRNGVIAPYRQCFDDQEPIAGTQRFAHADRRRWLPPPAR
jgi:hypothetical protein